MKLPGITYGPVQSLGREDVYGPIKEAQAISGALRQTAAVLGDIYEKQSMTQAEKALLAYDTGMAEWSQTQGPYQEDGTGTWLNGDELYSNAEQANRKTAEKELQTPMAKQLFARKVEERDAQNKVRWGAKQLGWMRDDELATAIKATEDYTNTRQFDKARETVVRQKVIGNMAPGEAQKQISRINYLENYYRHSDAVEGVWNAPTGRATIAEIKADTRLEERHKNTLIKATEDQMLQATTDEVFTKMSFVAAERGPVDAVALGEAIFAHTRDMPSEDIGSDENFKLATLNRINQVINTFKTQITRATAESVRLQNMNRVAAGLDPASADVNAQEYNDWYATSVLGWQLQGGGSKYVRNTPQVAIYTDPEIRNNTINFIDNYGVIPKTVDEGLQAALQAQRGQDGLNAVMTLHQISQASPEAMFKTGKHDMNAIASMAELMGGSEAAYQASYDSYLKVRDMDDAMKKTFYNASVFNEEFDDNFDDTLKQQYPVDNPWWAFWSDSTPVVKQHYRDRIKSVAKSFLPYTQGDTQSAMRMAMYSMRASFIPSKANGETPELMENAPELLVPNATYEGGDWLHQQRDQEIRATWGEDYNTEFVRAEPVPYFNRNDPAYILYDYNPELGFVRQLGIIKYDFDQTPEGQEQQRLAEQRARLNAFEMERKRQAVEYELNQDPENMKFYPMGSGRVFAPTPYGFPERKAGPIEQSVVALEKGKQAKQAMEKYIVTKGKEVVEDLFYPPEDAQMPKRLPYPGGG